MMVFVLILLAVAAFGWFVAGKNSDGTRSWPKTLVWCFLPAVIALVIFMYLKKKKQQLSRKMKAIRTKKSRLGFKGISLRAKALKSPSKKQNFLARMAAGRAKAARARKAAKKAA